MIEFFDFRLFYQKKGRIRYISHLDVNRCMQRTLQRSGLPIWYTQGFHPHPYVTFALPLSLGFESDYECMDFRLIENMPTDQIKQMIAHALPKGLIPLSVAQPEHSPSEIVSADYLVRLLTEAPCETKERLKQFLEQDRIDIEKKTKKGKHVVDLKKERLSYQVENDADSVSLYLSLPAGVHMINPLLLLDAFQKQYCNKHFRFQILRCAIYCKGGELLK